VAGAQRRPERGRLLCRQAGQHASFQGEHLVPALVQERPAGRGERDDETPTVVPVAVPFDQAAGLKAGDHVRHRLGGDERGPGQLRRGHVGVPLEHGQRRVLQGGQAKRADDVVEPRAGGEFDLLDQVQQQRRRGLGIRHVPRVPKPAR
jgi:hypothetical protein